jgi:uncharacterized membrane protein
MNHPAITETTFEPIAGQRPAALASAKTIHQVLTPFPVAYFVAALATDLAYWRTAEVMWERFSIWLIAGGLVLSALVALAAVSDLAFGQQRPAWFRALGYTAGVLVSLLNVFVHSRDGYTAVVPTGLMLSAVAVAILLLCAAAGSWTLTYRRGARS